MARDLVVYLEDMVEAVRRALAYTRGMNRASLFGDPKTVDAVVRNLEVLGEAAKHVPQDARTRHGEIDWKAIAELRETPAGRYFALNDDLLWDVVARKLPMLLPQLEECLSDERGLPPR
jgi:uncharacterized protein with HEPN domain